MIALLLAATIVSFSAVPAGAAEQTASGSRAVEVSTAGNVLADEFSLSGSYDALA